MSKLWKVLDKTEDTITYKWNGSIGNGLKFTIFHDEFNNWHHAQLEDREKIELPDAWLDIYKVAKILGLGI